MERLMYALKFGIIAMLVQCTMKYIVPLSVIHEHIFIFSLANGILLVGLTFFLLGKMPKNDKKEP